MPQRILPRASGIITGSGAGHWDDMRQFLGEGRNRYPVEWIIFKDGVNYYAQNGETGNLDYSGADASTVIQDALDVMTGGGMHFREAEYEINSTLTPPSEIFLTGNWPLLKATTPMNQMFDIRTKNHVHFVGLYMDGNNQAIKCIDGHRTTTAVVRNYIERCLLIGAQEANIDFTGNEDSSIINTKLDGRPGRMGVTVYTDYGLKIGESGQPDLTGGQITLVNLISQFCKKGDLYIRNLRQLNMYGGVLASKKVVDGGGGGASFEANIHSDGGAASWNSIHLHSVWMEAGGGHNILVEDTQMDMLSIIGNRWMATNTMNNIYSTLSPAIEDAVFVNTLFETSVVGFCIDCEIKNLHAALCRGWIGGVTPNWIDLSKVTRYWVQTHNANEIVQNIHMLLPNVTYYRGETVAGADVNLIGMGADDQISLGMGGYDVKTHSDIEFQGLYDIKDMIYSADATLSGTPRVIQVIFGVTPYYWKVYPTKT